MATVSEKVDGLEKQLEDAISAIRRGAQTDNTFIELIRKLREDLDQARTDINRLKNTVEALNARNSGGISKY